jgi:hypothetical protein
MGVNKKIAVLCNYSLLPERVGGMDYFFFGCLTRNAKKTLFKSIGFPNKSIHGE